MAEARASLRALLRSVQNHLTKANGNTLWRDHVVQQFRQHREVSSTEQAAELVEYARDQAELINAVQYQRVCNIRLCVAHQFLAQGGRPKSELGMLCMVRSFFYLIISESNRM